jgi:uroporphyrinogen III methyltransferase/synthase
MVQDQSPLKRKTIAVTRPCGQADKEAQIIRKSGGIPYLIPTIEIKSPSDLTPTKKFIEALAFGEFDLVIFMSVNGVKHLLAASENLNLSNELLVGLGKTVIVAVGPRTAEELKLHRIHVNLVPLMYTSEGIAECMQHLNVFNKKIAIPRTSAASPILKEKLAEMGASVKEVFVYESKLPVESELTKKFLIDLSSGRIHAIVFGSGLCAKNLFEMLRGIVPPDELASLLGRKATVVAIGPVTAKSLSEMGVKVDVTPEVYTFEDALTALARFWQMDSAV